MASGRSAAWVGLGLLLGACPGTDGPGLDDGLGPGSSSTGDRPGITTFNSTLDPTLPPDGGSMEAESTAGMGTTGSTGELDGTTTSTGEPGSTSGPGTTDPGTTTDASTTAPGSTGEPGSTSSSGDPGSSSSSSSTGGGCNAVPGNYDTCLDGAGMIDNALCMAGGDSQCLYAGMMGAPTAAVCSVVDCVDTCDCPAAPGSGTAPISCDDITADGAAECILDCSAGQICPTGMTCFGGFVCLWPGPGAGGTPYGDCLTDPNACGLDGICLNDGAMPTIGVCTEDCNVVGDCAPSPGGTAPVSCDDVTADGISECFLDCSAGQSCPAGMTCFASFLCAWN